jgi:hypothetical protein
VEDDVGTSRMHMREHELCKGVEVMEYDVRGVACP